MYHANKITRVDIRDERDQLLIPNVNYELMHQASSDRRKIIIIKGKDLPEVESGTLVFLVAYYKHGERMCYPSYVEISTEFQWNVLLSGESYKLKERRRFFKIAAELPVQITKFTSEEEVEIFDPPLKAVTQDINLGGVYLLAPLGDEHIWRVGDTLSVIISFEGKRVVTELKILRVREKNDVENVVHGYGCCFPQLTIRQEQIVAGYIYKCQWRHT